MDQVHDPPDSYYQKEYPWLSEREWREEGDDMTGGEEQMLKEMELSIKQAEAMNFVLTKLNEALERPTKKDANSDKD